MRRQDDATLGKSDSSERVYAAGHALVGACIGVGFMLALQKGAAEQLAGAGMWWVSVCGPVGGAVGWYLPDRAWAARTRRQGGEVDAGLFLRAPLSAVLGALVGAISVMLGALLAERVSSEAFSHAGLITSGAIGGLTAAMCAQALAIGLQIRQSLAEIVRQSKGADQPGQGND